MCWIAIAQWFKLKEILSNHQDRWLDGVWVWNWWIVYRASWYSYRWYKNFLRKKSFQWLSVLHNRQASVWEASLENTHPFVWKKFILAQNWTCKALHRALKETYKKEVDSHNLLCHLDDECNTISDCAIELERLVKEYISDYFWNIVVISDDKILFYSDWYRESFINIYWNRVVSITNYSPWKKEWYENKWYIIMDLNWLIIKNTFKELNEKKFYKRVVYSYQERTQSPIEYPYLTNWQGYLYRSYTPPLSLPPVTPTEKEKEEDDVRDLLKVMDKKLRFEYAFDVDLPNENKWDYELEKQNILNFFERKKYVYTAPYWEEVFEAYMCEYFYIYDWEPFKDTWGVDYPVYLFKNTFQSNALKYFL